MNNLDLKPYFSYTIHMNSNFYIVIMAGGSGTRLWPMSRKSSPKQLQKLAGKKSLLQETYERVRGLVPQENIFVSLVKDVLSDSQKQLKEVPPANFIVEPEAKNTAPAVGLIAAHIFRINPLAIIATIASDQTIEKVKNFQKAILATFEFVKKNPSYFTTIGIKPTRPDIGLGYIKIGQKFAQSPFYKVQQFVEKPDLKTAERYLKSGQYVWNASYFTWRVDKLLKMYERLAPEIYKSIVEIMKAQNKPRAQRETERIYRNMPTIPFDTAIAEKAEKIAVIPVDIDWSDVGTWASLYEILSKKHQSHTVTRGNHIGLGDKNCLIYAQDKLLATVGLEDIVIVDTPDVTLVCNKNKTQDVKKLIEKIKEQKKDKYL